MQSFGWVAGEFRNLAKFLGKGKYTPSTTDITQLLANFQSKREKEIVRKLSSEFHFNRSNRPTHLYSAIVLALVNGLSEDQLQYMFQMGKESLPWTYLKWQESENITPVSEQVEKAMKLYVKSDPSVRVSLVSCNIGFLMCR